MAEAHVAARSCGRSRTRGGRLARSTCRCRAARHCRSRYRLLAVPMGAVWSPGDQLHDGRTGPPKSGKSSAPLRQTQQPGHALAPGRRGQRWWSLPARVMASSVVVRALGEEVEFEVAVVLFGGGDGAVAELARDEDEAVSGGQPAGGGGMAKGVQWHGGQAGGAESVVVPLVDGSTAGRAAR